MCHRAHVPKAVAICLVALLSGCSGNAKYHDVSTDFPNLRDKTLVAAEPVILHAVAIEHYPKKIIDEYHITARPGFGGPEVIFRKDLPPGTKLKITNVEDCSNCWYDGLRAVVVPPSPEYADHPVSVSLDRGAEKISASGFQIE